MYSYEVRLEMGEKEKGTLFTPGKPRLEVSAPPEFQGTKGVWTPEDLFVASVESCLMTTLFYFLRRKKLAPQSYESNGVGILENTPKGMKFTSVKVEAILRLSEGENEKINADEMGALVEKYCLISQSVSCPVAYHLTIERR